MTPKELNAARQVLADAAFKAAVTEIIAGAVKGAVLAASVAHIPHPPVSQSVFSDFYPHLMLYFVPKPRNIGRR